MATCSSNKLITLFTPEEHAGFYGVPRFSEEDRVHFFGMSVSDQELVSSFRELADRIYCILMLGYFRAKACLISFSTREIIEDRRFIMQTWFPKRKIPRQLPSPERQARIHKKILYHEKALRCSKKIEHQIHAALDDLILRHPKAKPLTRAMLRYLGQQNIALPAYTTLQRFISGVLNREQVRIYDICHQVLSYKDIESIDRLLEQDEALYPISIIRKDVKDFTHSEMLDEIRRHELLSPLFRMGKTVVEQTGHPKKTIEYYGSLVNFYSVYKLKRMPREQARWYIICYSLSRYQKVNDNLIHFFQHHSTALHTETEAHAHERLREQHLNMDDALKKTGRVMQLFTEEGGSTAIEKHRAFQILPKSHMHTVQQFLLGNTRDEDLFYWAYIESISHKVILYLRKLFQTIDFSMPHESDPEGMIQTMKEILSSDNKCKLSDCHEQRLLKLVHHKLRPYVTDSSGKILWKRFEFHFYHFLSSRIKNKKMFLKNSLNYRPLNDELIQEDLWKKDSEKYIQNSGSIRLSEPIEQILEDHRKELDPLIVSVNDRILNGENQHIKTRLTESGTRWSLPYKKKTDDVNNPFFMSLPPVSIVDVLYFTDRHSAFLSAFTPIQPLSARQDRNDPLLLASILGNAIRMGTYKMATNASLNLQQLMTCEKTYLRLETIRDAIDIINKATAALPIFDLWNIDGLLHSSLDGSKIGTRLHTMKARYSQKYFGFDKGVSAYNMITNHLSANGRTIGANEHESHYIFSLVFNNTSGIAPVRHSGDGHSVNQMNFTLFDMLGHQFMPHFPRINKKTIYCFENLDKYSDCIVKPARKVRENLITDEWKNMQHIIASILHGETDQLSIIRLFASHDYQSRTKQAFWEYDNILSSLHILNYVDDIRIRQAVRAALNRGEAYHQLYRAISCISGGRFRGSSELEIEIWNECTRLVASAVIFYNAYILSALLERAKNDGQRDEIIQLSPVAWAHLNFLGQYVFTYREMTDEIQHWLKQVRL